MFHTTLETLFFTSALHENSFYATLTRGIWKGQFLFFLHVEGSHLLDMCLFTGQYSHLRSWNWMYGRILLTSSPLQKQGKCWNEICIFFIDNCIYIEGIKHYLTWQSSFDCSFGCRHSTVFYVFIGEGKFRNSTLFRSYCCFGGEFIVHKGIIVDNG